MGLCAPNYKPCCVSFKKCDCKKRKNIMLTNEEKSFIRETLDKKQELLVGKLDALNQTLEIVSKFYSEVEEEIKKIDGILQELDCHDE
jgi:hypothetical protein